MQKEINQNERTSVSALLIDIAKLVIPIAIALVLLSLIL